MEVIVQGELKIFRPRDKELSCVHWIDCYKKAEWVVEHPHNEGSYFEYYCSEHLKKLTDNQKEKK